ncbi:AAA family ATPase, partial [Candidatus Igneacidithiobacillus taiwanensis]|uniref:AAA family ATPase n=1 Tax=Candidatus Igneacidithiobacillus taiwanensis TaxID=1945924 RepID=UPI002897830D
MSDPHLPADTYRVHREPYYQPQGNEVALFEAAYRKRLPVMVKGPTGCGKSRFVEYMAWKLGKPLITVACNEDMTASDLVGRYLLDANGTRWIDGPLTTAARMGAICYLHKFTNLWHFFGEGGVPCRFNMSGTGSGGFTG